VISERATDRSGGAIRFDEGPEYPADRTSGAIRFGALIFDFDGVLIESEYVGNKQIADYLTSIGHPTSVEESMNNFMGLAGDDFLGAIERWIGRALPQDFHAARAEEDARAIAEGVGAVAGAVAFIESLPPELPRAIASSSSTRWIEAHLDHLELRRHFDGRIFSGREHVKRGKPSPDIYLLAAASLGIPIERVAIIEDSPVGVTGAVASGAFVIGLAAGRHCFEGHGDRLRSLGAHVVAHSFQEVAAALR
jgi:HAD superfamily hydrolase (TIGR01509 family)